MRKGSDALVYDAHERCATSRQNPTPTPPPRAACSHGARHLNATSCSRSGASRCSPCSESSRAASGSPGCSPTCSTPGLDRVRQQRLARQGHPHRGEQAARGAGGARRGGRDLARLGATTERRKAARHLPGRRHPPRPMVGHGGEPQQVGHQNLIRTPRLPKTQLDYARTRRQHTVRRRGRAWFGISTEQAGALRQHRPRHHPVPTVTASGGTNG